MNESRIPPDKNGIFDGDSFYEQEFKAWCYTCDTYNRIKLRTWNISLLISRLNVYEKKYRNKILYKQLSRNLLELQHLGAYWND